MELTFDLQSRKYNLFAKAVVADFYEDEYEGVWAILSNPYYWEIETDWDADDIYWSAIEAYNANRPEALRWEGYPPNKQLDFALGHAYADLRHKASRYDELLDAISEFLDVRSLHGFATYDAIKKQFKRLFARAYPNLEAELRELYYD